MDRAAERKAFARACTYLKFQAGAQWGARLAAVGTGLLYVALLVVLWLFADLVIGRGRLPVFHELPPVVQQEFLDDWQIRDPGARRDALGNLGAPVAVADALAAAEKPEVLTPLQSDWLSRVYLAERLTNRVGPTAASVVFEDRPDVFADRGALSLVVRARGPERPFGAFVGLLARIWPWTWRHGNTAYLTGLLITALVLALLRGLLSYAAREWAAAAVVEATIRLRRSVYHHTYRLGTLAIKALGPTEAVSIFTRHLEAVHDALLAWLTVRFREPIKFGLLLAFALLVNFWLAIAFFLFTVLVYLIGGQVRHGLRRRAKVADHRAAEQQTLLRESLMMMRLVKVYLMELFNQSRVERLLSRYRASQLERHRGDAISRPVLATLAVMACIVLLFAAGLIVLRERASVAASITLATALVSLYWPLSRTLDQRRVLRRGRESAAALFSFLGRPGDVGQVVGAEFLPPLAKQLEFDNVTLREPGTNRLLLHEVSLTIRAGQRVALVGPEDLEKHALVYLLPRFLDPTSGEIRVDEHNLRWVTLDSLRAQTAVVLQHNLVFHDTVANNIGCGDPAFTLPQIIEAAKLAHAHHFIQKLPQGYETPVGELGHTLSVSEQFRIALARAILRDPALFIIEEPASGMDEDTKALLDDTFARVLPGRTAIFLPHRLSTIKNCDQVFLLHKGRLEAAGEHRDLIATHALYRHLHYLQYSEVPEHAA